MEILKQQFSLQDVQKKQWGEAFARKQEDIVREAINHVMGTTKWIMKEIKSRCEWVVDGEGRPFLFRMDGKDLLLFHKVIIKEEKGKSDSRMISMSRNYEILYKEK